MASSLNSGLLWSTGRLSSGWANYCKQRIANLFTPFIRTRPLFTTSWSHAT